jgi:hypothetical protein
LLPGGSDASGDEPQRQTHRPHDAVFFIALEVPAVFNGEMDGGLILIALLSLAIPIYLLQRQLKKNSELTD